MMSPSGSEVVVADASEQDAIASLLTLAFARDPVTRWVWPHPHVHVMHYPTFVRAFGGNAFAHGAAYRTKDFGGAALWLPPGVESDVEALAGLIQTTVDESRHGDLMSFLGQMGGYHPTEPHWYLPLIGCDPTAQGRGNGGALLRYALERVDHDKLPAYLESSNPANVPLYQRHGFEVTGTIQVEGGPAMFPMLRAARR
jgi:ribosomal protein S18 acetylase RimI-like enzyme